MYKVKLINRGGFDGSTPVVETPEFRRAEGWSEAEISGPAGILPAGLWGQVPEGDPFLMHACFLTSFPIDAQSFLEVLTGEPMRTRVQYIPGPDNTRVTLVRPSDRIRLKTSPQELVKVELLLESIGGTNELGSRLYEWAGATARSGDTGVRIVRFDQSASLSVWNGTLHVIYDAAAPGEITLPIRQLVPTDVVMTITRASAGVPTLLPLGNDKFAGGQGALQVLRSALIMNNGEQWTIAGT